MIKRNDPDFKKVDIFPLSEGKRSTLKPQGLKAAPLLPKGVYPTRKYPNALLANQQTKPKTMTRSHISGSRWGKKKGGQQTREKE